MLHCDLVRLMRRNDSIADRERHTSFPKTRDELWRWGIRQQLLLTSCRVIQHSAIFGHHPFKEIAARKYRRKIFQLPPAYKDQFSTRCRQPLQRCYRGARDLAIASQSFIVVAGQSQVTHFPLPPTGWVAQLQDNECTGPFQTTPLPIFLALVVQNRAKWFLF